MKVIKESDIEVKLINMTPNPLETLYRNYKICYAKGAYEDVVIPSEEKMINFIKPLMKEDHLSPFEHISFSFSINGISRAAQQQLTRHRTFKFNVQSQRYVDAENFGVVLPDFGYMEDESKRNLTEYCFIEQCENAFNMYKTFVEHGVKKEDARALLPMATMSNMSVTVDARNFRNFLALRTCAHAQREIRIIANKMKALVQEHVPFIAEGVLLCQQGRCNNCSK